MLRAACRIGRVAVVLVLMSPGSNAEAEDGVFTRITEVRVPPNQVRTWEDGLASLAASVRKAELSNEIDWLTYRRDPGRYWIVTFSDGFGDVLTADHLSASFAGVPEEGAFKAAISSLRSTDVVISSDSLWQQAGEWSTTSVMDPGTHPLAVVREFLVHPPAFDDFERAMDAYVELIRKIEYPYAMEGFRPRLGKLGRYLSVSFPDTWEKYYGSNRLELLAKQKGLAEEYDGRWAELLGCSQSVEETLLVFAPSLTN